MSRFLIYGLTDPRTAEVRYIGKSSSGMKRPIEHGRLRHRKTHKERWIGRLLAEGVEYGIVIIAEFQAGDQLYEHERFAIAWAREIGWPLTNATDGGEGVTGLVHSAAARAKMSEKHRNRSPEHRKAIGDANRGRKLTDEHIAKLRYSAKLRSADPTERARLASLRKGAVNSPEARAKTSAANRGRVATLEERKKNSEVHRGIRPSDATRAKMSASRRRVRPPKPPIERTCRRCLGVFSVRFKSDERQHCRECFPPRRRRARGA